MITTKLFYNLKHQKFQSDTIIQLIETHNHVNTLEQSI